MRLTTKLAKPIMQHLRHRPLDPGGPIDEEVDTAGCTADAHPSIFVNGQRIRIVKEYQYLGRWTGAHASPVHDVAVRKACATSAFRTHRRVLTSSKYTLATRIYLYKALVRCHLLQNVMTYSRLSTRLRDSLAHTYVSLLKKTVMLKAADQILPIRDEDLLNYIGEPAWEKLVQYRIATFLHKVCSSANSQVRAALAATGPSSLWTEWLPVLRELHSACPGLQALPFPSTHTVVTWLAFIVPAGSEWSKLARSTLLGAHKPAIDLSRNVTVHAANVVRTDPVPIPQEDGVEDGEVPAGPQHPDEEQGTIPCPLCDRFFKATKGLIVHKIRQHGVVPPLALRVRSTTCTACGAEHGTRARLLDHMRRKLSCALHTMYTIEPMSLEEYLSSVNDLNAEDNLMSRQLPSTGPIPLIGGVNEVLIVKPAVDLPCLERSVELLSRDRRSSAASNNVYLATIKFCAYSDTQGFVCNDAYALNETLSPLLQPEGKRASPMRTFLSLLTPVLFTGNVYNICCE
eukprot:6487180-Amphidinium_carterae.1